MTVDAFRRLAAANTAWQKILDDWGEELKNDEPIQGSDLVDSVSEAYAQYEEDLEGGEGSSLGPLKVVEEVLRREDSVVDESDVDRLMEVIREDLGRSL